MNRRVPTLPPAPARFSTTTDWPRDRVRLCASNLARRSVVPPGGHGTTMWMARSGYRGASEDCAIAPLVGASTHSRQPIKRQIHFMATPGEHRRRAVALAPTCSAFSVRSALRQSGSGCQSSGDVVGHLPGNPHEFLVSDEFGVALDF